MTHILEEWVKTRLGLAIDFENIGNEFYDGYLFFKILQCYDVVGPEIKLYMRRAKTPEEALRNLSLLRLNFKLLGVVKDNYLLEEISKKNDRACIELLSQLYLKLSNRHSLPVIPEGKEKQVLQQDSSRFKVFKVKEKECLLPSHKKPEEKLLSQLKNSIKTLENETHNVFQENKEVEKERTQNEVLQETARRITDQIKKNLEECKCGTTVEECLRKFDKRVMEYQAMGDTSKDPCPPDDYVKILKLRRLKQITDKTAEIKFKEIIVKRLWCKQMKESEEELRSSLAKKLLQQSTYEKKMSERLGRIHQQYRAMAERRRKVHEDLQRIYEERLAKIEWQQNSTSDNKYFKEKKRLQELHKNIFTERQAKVREEKKAMIEAAVSDLIDFSIKVAQYKENFSFEMPPRELKQLKILFFKALPIFPKPSLILVNEDEKSDSDESFESLLHQEAAYEDELNEHDLNDYLILLGPWVKELWPELETFEEDLRVLGFLVHRLLEYKYPPPEPPKPVEVPEYPIRVIVNNLTDSKAIKTLKSLLTKPKIEILDLTTLINICIGQYKTEAGIEDKLSKKKSKGKEKEKPKKDKKKKVKEQEPPFKTVETQFPSLLNLDLPPQLSSFAEVGKRVFDILGSGGSIPEDLVAEIFIEYLNTPSDREGWVLLNFPVDCKQVHFMEFKFTGIQPPINCDLIFQEPEKETVWNICESESNIDNLFDMIGEDESMTSKSEVSLNTFMKLRKSILLPRPNPEQKEPQFHTYFTHFIQVENASDVQVNEQNTVHQHSANSLDEGSLEEKLSKSNLEIIQSPKMFYEKTDIYVPYNYSKLNLETLKKLARVILDETDQEGPDRKPSIELFGDIAVQKPSKTPKSKKNSLKTATKSRSKVPKELTEEVIYIKPEDIIGEEAEEQPSTTKEESRSCQVGDDCWEYSTLDIQGDFMVALASFWESIELSYINKFKEMFSIYREHDAVPVPYRNFILNKITANMNIPDNRQIIVNEFVNDINRLDDILRCNAEIKKDLFCKIFELQLQLWDLCDLKKNVTEQEILNIINKKWLPRHACGLFNIFINMLETEIDRSLDSLKLLQDYYLSSCGKPIVIEPEPKIYIPRYKISDFDDLIDFNDMSMESDEIKSNSIENNALQNSNSSFLKNTLEVTLDPEGIIEYYREVSTNSNFKRDQSSRSQFFDNMNTVEEKLKQEISFKTDNYITNIVKEKKALLQKNQSKSKKKRTATAKKKRGKKESIVSAVAGDSEEAKKKLAIQNALLEWSKAVQDEKDRVFFRISLIKNRFFDDLSELEDLILTTFYGLYNEISKRFFDQSKNIDSLIRVLMASVEAESKIEPQLELKLDSFCVVPVSSSISISSEVVPPPPATPIVEIDDAFSFKVQQLIDFAEKMVSVSPIGILAESLVAILEDMVLLGKENGYPYLPKGWSLLQRNDLRKLVRNVFGDAVIVDWKDFLICGLEYRFPSVEEIINLRDKYLALDLERTETISEDDFKGILLWFETDLCKSLNEDLRVVLSKRFLFNLFKVEESLFNYTAFLLNFCKDENPIDGFGKALALATGYGYVLNEDNLHLLRLEEKTESEIIAEQIINILLQDSINRCLGTVITEIDGDGNPIKDDDFEFVKDDYFLETEPLLKACISKEPDVSYAKSEGSIARTSMKKQSKSSMTSKSKQSVTNNTSIEHKSTETLQISDIAQCKTLDTNVVWKSWLPREVVLSLLLTSLTLYALPEDLYYLQEQVQSELKLVYEQFGKYDCIQGYVLIQSDYMKNLLSTCFKFKSCNLAQLVRASSSINVS